MKLEFNRNSTGGDDMFFNTDSEKVNEKSQEAINFIIEQLKNGSRTTMAHLLEAGATLAETPEELCIITVYLTTWWLDFQEKRLNSLEKITAGI